MWVINITCYEEWKSISLYAMWTKLLISLKMQIFYKNTYIISFILNIVCQNWEKLTNLFAWFVAFQYFVTTVFFVINQFFGRFYL